MCPNEYACLIPSLPQRRRGDGGAPEEKQPVPFFSVTIRAPSQNVLPVFRKAPLGEAAATAPPARGIAVGEEAPADVAATGAFDDVISGDSAIAGGGPARAAESGLLLAVERAGSAGPSVAGGDGDGPGLVSEEAAPGPEPVFDLVAAAAGCPAGNEGEGGEGGEGVPPPAPAPAPVPLGTEGDAPLSLLTLALPADPLPAGLGAAAADSESDLAQHVNAAGADYSPTLFPSPAGLGSATDDSSSESDLTADLSLPEFSPVSADSQGALGDSLRFDSTRFPDLPPFLLEIFCCAACVAPVATADGLHCAPPGAAPPPHPHRRLHFSSVLPGSVATRPVWRPFYESASCFGFFREEAACGKCGAHLGWLYPPPGTAYPPPLPPVPSPTPSGQRQRRSRGRGPTLSFGGEADAAWLSSPGISCTGALSLTASPRTPPNNIRDSDNVLGGGYGRGRRLQLPLPPRFSLKRRSMVAHVLDLGQRSPASEEPAA